jgi:hypothetical protein
MNTLLKIGTIALAVSFATGITFAQQNIMPINKFQLAQAPVKPETKPKPVETSTCAPRNKQCSGTCVGKDAGKNCRPSDLKVSGSCSCQ